METRSKETVKQEIENLEKTLAVLRAEYAQLLEREGKKIDKILLDISEEYQGDNIKNNRDRGAWIKTVTGLDKSKTNGYSILGNFLKQGRQYYYDGCLYIAIDERRNSVYQLFTVREGKIKLLQKTSGINWATDFWKTIEENLPAKEEKPLLPPSNVSIPNPVPIPGFNVPCPRCDTYCGGDCTST